MCYEHVPKSINSGLIDSLWIHCYIVNVIKMQFVFWPKLYTSGDCKVLYALPQSDPDCYYDWTANHYQEMEDTWTASSPGPAA